MKHGESGGPEPLTFTHNGQPATIDLERFKPQPQTEQPVPVEVKRPVAPEPLTFTHNGEPATINLERFQQQLQDEPLTFTHNGQPATVDLERFTRQAQKEIHMKHGEIGAPRNTGDVGVAPVPEVGSVKIVILNGSRQIDQVVPGVGRCWF